MLKKKERERETKREEDSDRQALRVPIQFESRNSKVSTTLMAGSFVFRVTYLKLISFTFTGKGDLCLKRKKYSYTFV